MPRIPLAHFLTESEWKLKLVTQAAGCQSKSQILTNLRNLNFIFRVWFCAKTEPRKSSCDRGLTCPKREVPTPDGVGVAVFFRIHDRMILQLALIVVKFTPLKSDSKATSVVPKLPKKRQIFTDNIPSWRPPACPDRLRTCTKWGKRDKFAAVDMVFSVCQVVRKMAWLDQIIKLYWLGMGLEI